MNGEPAMDCALSVPEQLIDKHSDGAYTVMQLALACPNKSPKQLTITYRLFADIDRVGAAHDGEGPVLRADHAT